MASTTDYAEHHSYDDDSYVPPPSAADIERAGEIAQAQGVYATATEPYTCRDGECRDREAAGKRCPWCWGGFPRREAK